MQADKDWWSALKAGEEAALAHIYTQYIDDLLSYGQRFSVDTALVEDCVQDLFIQLWKQRAGLGATSSVRAYLFVALRRRIIRTTQQRFRHSSFLKPEDYPFEAELAIEELMIAREDSREQSRQLATAFAQLSKRQQEVLYLRFYQGLDYEEIGEVMDIGYQSIRNLVSAATSKLRGFMELLLLLVLFWMTNTVQNGFWRLFL